jgi:hypothetical protein
MNNVYHIYSVARVGLSSHVDMIVFWSFLYRIEHIAITEGNTNI